MKGDDKNMKERTKSISTEKRLLGVNELTQYLSMGKNKSVEYARSIGAERRFGKRVLFDKVVIDKAINESVYEL